MSSLSNFQATKKIICQGLPVLFLRFSKETADTHLKNLFYFKIAPIFQLTLLAQAQYSWTVLDLSSPNRKRYSSLQGWSYGLICISYM